MCPVLENRLVQRLRLLQVLAAVVGNPREQNVVMAALDDVDRIDLHVAQVPDRRRGCGGPLPKGAGVSSFCACSQIRRACALLSVIVEFAMAPQEFQKIAGEYLRRHRLSPGATYEFPRLDGEKAGLMARVESHETGLARKISPQLTSGPKLQPAGASSVVAAPMKKVLGVIAPLFKGAL